MKSANSQTKWISMVILSFVLILIQCKKADDGDGRRPVIEMLGYNPQYWAQGLPYTDAGAIAYDINDTGDTLDLTSQIVVTSNVDVAVSGDYSVFYNVKDASGLAAEQLERIVKVQLTR